MRFGIDVGGTKAHAIVIDDAGHTLAEVRVPSGQGEREVLGMLRAGITELSAHAGGVPATSLGIGIPGSVDADRGVVMHAVNLAITELDLAAGMRDLVDGPVRVDNDMNTAALGAYDRLGSGAESLAYLNVGTGLAAGLVLHGSVWRGHRGIAGEIGHVPIARNGVVCPCGQVGCLETAASGIAISRMWTAHPVSAGRGLVQGIADGEPLALSVRDTVVTGIADAMQMLMIVVGAERVVVGGGVVLNIPGIFDGVLADLAARASGSPFLTDARLAERVVLAPRDSDLPALGAALLPGASGVPAAR